ncbi:translation elongation factor Ts [Candidatus Phytoplasma sacchari]|uniref:Elongation factor Ts n=1 Tax=Candidatus Phytoplasma sacchari TaxID=2609813 RepID=A0ABY7M3K3_9MOLU|nr:translation elongation factor Ts [Candidatus Phytoplasma sacchari]KAB8122135.1 translation elongation factor Ts [Candidatus Phytoplasma sacchari]WBL31463.1 translation elongation factor Ts [Candidatus Phytoplasma sacchari]
MKITIEMIQKVRNQTRAGIVECKKALEKTNGNIDDSIFLIRKKMVSQNIDFDKEIELSEGLVNVSFRGNKAILFELNTETDFVSKSEFFLDFCKQLEEILFSLNFIELSIDVFLNSSFNGNKIKDIISEKIFILGERIVLKRIKIVYKQDKESFGIYKHYNKISCLVKLSNSCFEVEKEMPIHIAFFNPKFISKDKVDSVFIDKIKKEIMEEVIAENSKNPVKLLEKEINNRLESYLNEICLFEQYLYNDSNQKILDYLKNKNTDVIEFYRYQLGEKIK